MRGIDAKANNNELITSIDPQVKTVVDLMDYAVNKYGDMDSLGQRKVIKTHTENKEITKIVGGEEVKEMKEWKVCLLLISSEVSSLLLGSLGSVCTCNE